MSFEELLKKATSLDELKEQAEEDGGKKDFKDPRFWKPTPDDAGNAQATIRFLPSPTTNAKPWSKYFEYGFKGENGWYFEKSRQTISGEADPVADYNRKQYNNTVGGDEVVKARREECSRRRRKVNFIYNILVIDDPKNSENNGKVFLYRSGKQIFDMIKEAMNPKFVDDDTQPFNPFDFMKGADFKYRAYEDNKFTKLDKCAFSKPAPLFGGDIDKLKKVYDDLHDLSEFDDPATIKSYAELEAKFNQVMGFNVTANTQNQVSDTSPSSEQPTHEPDIDDDKDDDLEYLKNLSDDGEDD